jgi:hypothetical protein
MEQCIGLITSAPPSMKAVIFDLGGVVADSPIMTIRAHGETYGIGDPNRFLGDSHAWDSYMQV